MTSRDRVWVAARKSVSIFRQDVDVTQLPLNLLDTPDAGGPLRPVARIRHCGPASMARDDSDRDRWGAVIERRKSFAKHPDKVGAGNSFFGQRKIPLKELRDLEQEHDQGQSRSSFNLTSQPYRDAPSVATDATTLHRRHSKAASGGGLFHFKLTWRLRGRASEIDPDCLKTYCQRETPAF